MAKMWSKFHTAQNKQIIERFQNNQWLFDNETNIHSFPANFTIGRLSQISISPLKIGELKKGA